MLPVVLVDGVVLEVVVAAEVRVRPAVVVVDRRLRWLGGQNGQRWTGARRSSFVAGHLSRRAATARLPMVRWSWRRG